MECLVDWFLSDAGQRLAQNIIAVAAIILAARGVRNWSRERRDLRRAELAEQSLAVAYRARDAISSVRSPFGHSGEGSSRKREPGETPEQQERRDSAFAPVERLSHIHSLFEELQSIKYNVTAAFGVAAAEPLNEFLKVRNEIISAARMRYTLHDRPPVRITPELQDLENRYEAVIWQLSETDEIASRLNAAVDQLEHKFRPYVEARFRAIT